MRIVDLYENEVDVYDVIFNTKFFKVNVEPIAKNPNDGFENSHVLYHGSKSLKDQDYRVLPLLKRTGPRDSSTIVHNAINDASEKRFGVPVRNLMFASNNSMATREYGSTYVVIPVGQYRLFYSKIVEDLYSENNGYLNDEAYNKFIRAKVSKFLTSAQYTSTVMELSSLIGEDSTGPSTFFSAELMPFIPKILEKCPHTTIDERYEKDYDVIYDLVYDVFLNRLIKFHSDVEDIPHDTMKSVNALLSDLTKTFINHMKDVSKEWLDVSVNEYLDTIQTTVKVSDIPQRHESMIDAKEVIFIPYDDWNTKVAQAYFQRQREK